MVSYGIIKRFHIEEKTIFMVAASSYMKLFIRICLQIHLGKEVALVEISN